MAEALTSGNLPRDFFNPATRRRTEGLAESVQRGFKQLGTATNSLLRVFALAAGVSWLVVLYRSWTLMGSHLPEAHSDIDRVIVLVAWLILLVCGVAVLLTGIFNAKRYFSRVLGGSAIVYGVLVLIHSVLTRVLPESPLDPLKLGDFAALPAASLVAAWPGGIVIVMSLAVVVLSAAMNFGTPSLFLLLLQVMYATLLVAPFIWIVSNGLRTTQAIDHAAERVHRDAAVMARQKAMAELETRFMAFIHDRVLTQLAAIRRGAVDADGRELGQLLENVAEEEAPRVRVLRDAVHDVIAAVTSEYPEAQVQHPHDRELGDFHIPVEASAAITDAMRQAAVNVARHAPGARAELGFTFQTDGGGLTGMQARLTDDGPGFDLDSVSEDRVGVRVSILGRLAQTRGCLGDVYSTPGGGTEVISGWARSAVDAEDAQSRQQLPSVYEAMGFSDIYRLIPAICVWLVFFALSLFNDQPRPWLWAASLAVAGATLLLLIQRNRERLPVSYAAGAMGLIWGFYILAAATDIADGSTWPYTWYPRVGILLAAFLAMRNRPVFGWAAWLGCIVIGEIFHGLGYQSQHLELATVWWRSVVLIPATLLPLMIKRVFDGLPLLLADNRAQATRAAVDATQDDYIFRSREWLRHRITILFNPHRSADEKVLAARLMEQRLRDSIRSPLFDVPTITAAAWDARLRGATVKLLDDLSASEVTPPARQMAELKASLIPALRRAQSGDTVVARLLPPGRSKFATVLSQNGATGDSATVQIQAGAEQRP